jgi:hypothetical protein
MAARVSDVPGRMELRWCGVPVLGVVHHTSGEQATLPAPPATLSRPAGQPCQTPP